MARRYVNPTRAVPSTPEEFAEELYGCGHEGARIVRDYAGTFIKRDRGEVAAQIRDQLRAYPAAIRAAVMGRVSYSSAAALHNPSSPAAKANGICAGLGDVFAAAWYPYERAGGTRGPGAKLRQQILNSFSSEVPDTGGFLVPEEWRQEVMALALEQSIVRPRALVMPMGSGRLSVPVTDATSNVTTVFGGLTATWTEESAQLSESQASFALATLDAKALKAYFNAPNELVMDAGPAWEQFVQAVVPQAVSWYEDVAFLVGDGVSDPLGVCNSEAAIQVPKETGQAAASVLWENCVKVFARMLPSSLSRSVWLVAPDAYTELAGMAVSVGTAGGPVWLADGTMSLLSRPVLYHQALPKLGSVGDVNLVDLGAFIVGDRQLMAIDSSPHLKFNLDVSSYRVRHRVDGRMALQSAVTPRNNASNTLSTVVQIAAR